MQHLFKVTGMTCGHCERAVKQAVQQLDPQAQVKVTLASGQVEVESAQPRAVLAQAIVEEGYAVAA
jgi:copper chaperone